MLSAAYSDHTSCDSNYIKLMIIVQFFLPYVHLLIVIIWLLLSVYLCPKVITLTGSNV
jgi:hypothetical protein